MMRHEPRHIPHHRDSRLRDNLDLSVCFVPAALSVVSPARGAVHCNDTDVVGFSASSPAGRAVMTVLTTFAALALATACQTAADPMTVLGIAAHESGLDPLAIHDNADNRRYSPTTKADAIHQARALIASHAGARIETIDVGLMQINSANFGWLGLTIENAFDPCKSIEAGAKVLIAFSRYNTGNPSAGISNGYAPAVVRRIHTLRATTPAPMAQSTHGIDATFSRPSQTGREVLFATSKGKN
jgi:type IV secretion system protein VirB1